MPPGGGVSSALRQAWFAIPPVKQAFFQARATINHSRPLRNQTIHPLITPLAKFVKYSITGLFYSARSASSSTLGRTIRNSYQPVASNVFTRTAARGPRSSKYRYPSTPANVGLGTARNFSYASTRPIFDNIIQNVPLGLRALADHAGIDERKWKKSSKGQGRKRAIWEQTARAWGLEEEAYLTSRVIPATTVKGSTVLIINLQPSYITPLVATASLSPANSFERLLTEEVIYHGHNIITAYQLHEKQLQAMYNRLSVTGAFDKNLTCREVRGIQETMDCEEWVWFSSGWTGEDIRSILENDNDSFSTVQWRIVETSRKSMEENDQSDTGSLSPLLSNSGVEEDGVDFWDGTNSEGTSSRDEMALHDQVSSRFLFPDLAKEIAFVAEEEDMDSSTIIWEEGSSGGVSVGQRGIGENAEDGAWSFSLSDSFIEESHEIRELLDDIERDTRDREFFSVVAGVN